MDEAEQGEHRDIEHPDARMKKNFTDAAARGAVTGRAQSFRVPEKWAYYAGSGRQNMLFEGAYTFDTTPPMVTKDRVMPFPPDRCPLARCAQYLLLRLRRDQPGHVREANRHRLAVSDGICRCHKNYFDGAKTYKVTLPKGVPAARFWSVTLFDNLMSAQCRRVSLSPPAAAVATSIDRLRHALSTDPACCAPTRSVAGFCLCKRRLLAGAHAAHHAEERR
jgi:hypothetical protein